MGWFLLGGFKRQIQSKRNVFEFGLNVLCEHDLWLQQKLHLRLEAIPQFVQAIQVYFWWIFSSYLQSFPSIVLSYLLLFEGSFLNPTGWIQPEELALGIMLLSIGISLASFFTCATHKLGHRRRLHRRGLLDRCHDGRFLKVTTLLFNQKGW